MDKGKRNIIIVIVILAMFEIYTTILQFIQSKDIGVFNIFVYFTYCLIFQSLYSGKRCARNIVLAYSYWNVLQTIWLIWLPSIISREPVQFFGRMRFVGIVFLWIALFLTFNKNIKRYITKQLSK